MPATQTSEQKLRDYEASVELVNQDPSALGRVETKLDDLIKEINNDDLIYKMNCLQLVADLASTSKGLSFLESKGVPNMLIALLKQGDHLVVPHVLKFFCRIDPLLLGDKYPDVLDKVYEFLQTDNELLLVSVIDFIGVLGRSGYSTRLMLDNRSRQTIREKCFTRLGSIITCSDTSIKARTLQCITDLLELHDDDPEEESSKLSEEWYKSIVPGEGRMTSSLLSLCRQPFVEVKTNAMQVIVAIADQVWGQKELANQSTFLPWLLNRSTETCKEGKEAKFNILQTLVKSPTTSRVFRGEEYMKMRSDFKNGPFHVELDEEMRLEHIGQG